MQVHYLMLNKGLTTAGGASVKHWLGPVAWKRQPAHRIRVTKAMVHDHQTTRVSSMKKFLLSSVALLGFTAGAMAADLPRRAPPVFVPVPVFTWTGFYVGVNAGYGWNNGDDNTCLGCFGTGALFVDVAPGVVAPVTAAPFSAIPATGFGGRGGQQRRLRRRRSGRLQLSIHAGLGLRGRRRG